MGVATRESLSQELEVLLNLNLDPRQCCCCTIALIQTLIYLVIYIFSSMFFVLMRMLNHCSIICYKNEWDQYMLKKERVQ